MDLALFLWRSFSRSVLDPIRCARCLGSCTYLSLYISYGIGIVTVLQIPILLAEMSPPAFRATFPGVAYQLGNMVSSASAQIEATGGDHLKTTLIINGKPTVVPDYATVQGILIGVVAIFVICVTILAPEYVFSISPSLTPNKHMDRNHSSHFEQAKAAFEEGAGEDEMEEEGAPETEKIGGEKGSIERESVVIESTV